MVEFTVDRQDNLIRALMDHPDNRDHSAQFALGYMSMMLMRAIEKLDADDRALFMADIDYLIDRYKRQAQRQKVAG